MPCPLLQVSDQLCDVREYGSERASENSSSRKGVRKQATVNTSFLSALEARRLAAMGQVQARTRPGQQMWALMLFLTSSLSSETHPFFLEERILLRAQTTEESITTAPFRKPFLHSELLTFRIHQGLLTDAESAGVTVEHSHQRRLQHCQQKFLLLQ